MNNLESDSQFLLALGGILLLGLVTSTLGRRTTLPRVTLLLIFGVVIGKQGLDMIPTVFSDRFEIITDMALLMVGFLLGGKLNYKSLRQSMEKILWISISAAVVTTIIVSLGLSLLGVPPGIAILLGCLASATDPAAIFDVTVESDYKGPFKDLLLSIVALDDAWALVLFGLGLAVVSSLLDHSGDLSPLLMIAKDIGGAIGLGLAIGFPAAFLTGRIKPGQPILSEALGIVLICGGLAIWLGVSFLIAAMVLGSVIANFAKHHEHPFHAIEGIEWPLMVVFFVLAGAALDLKMIADISVIGVAYIILRIGGKILGATLGSLCSGANRNTQCWMGVALLPQAGIAIGMALVASNYFPEYRDILLPLVISTTIFFEITGPVFTRMSLTRVSTT